MHPTTHIGNHDLHSPERRSLLGLALGVPLTAALPLLRSGSASAADLPSLVAASKPSIVAVGVFAPLQNPKFRFHGTGFVVGDGRRVVTCAHVLPTIDPTRNESIAIAVPGEDGAELRKTRIASIDRDTDLALIELEGAPLPALALADQAEIREGIDVILMGFPIGNALGLFVASHRGVVAAITPMIIPAANSAGLRAQSVQVMRGVPIQLLQLDVTSFPGNSGGPLLDLASGRVVGVTSLGVTKGSRENAIQFPSGIGYAVPIRYVHALLGAR